MESSFKESLWKQFGASIDMLENAIEQCPYELWDSDKKFWYNAYHCLFWLDYYLSLDPDEFSPPPPFTLSEFDPSGVMPERTYSKSELLTYLNGSRNKCHQLLASLTAEELISKHWVNVKKGYTVFEILLYNMRHVQHHAAQLNLVLRQELNQAPDWVSQTPTDL